MAAKVFVFIPTFNVEAYVARAIESVIAQTYSDWELLVLDDCSTDGTCAIIAPYTQQDSRINFLQNANNLGMLNNWNRGVSFCRSPFFVKLDGDDYWHPHMIAKAMTVLERDESTALVFSKYVNIDEKGNICEGTAMELPYFARGVSFSCIDLVKQGEAKMLSYPVLRQGLSLLRSKVFKDLGEYRHLLTEQTQASTDTEFYFRIGCHYQIHCIDEVLYYYRVHSQSISAQDHAKGLAERKIYELKLVINSYYFSQRKISRFLWKKNKAQIEFAYVLFLNYQSRKESRIFKTIELSFRLFVSHPLLFTQRLFATYIKIPGLNQNLGR